MAPEEPPPPPRQVRKTVTVVFCDLADSTPLAERLDPEAMRLVLARYFEVATDSFHRHGGTVEKFIGDAVVAIFGIPTLHEDDALRAIRAAVELRARLPELNAELDRDFGVGVSVRIGVNTGEVVAGDPSSGQALVTGDPVNTAARLEQSAEPGEILLGEITYALVRGAVRAEPLPDLALKGKVRSVGARRLLAFDPTAPPVPRRLDAPLVGRQGELAQLRVALDRAVGERTAVLFTVLGPPGIGKTRLAQEFASSVEDRATVITGRCLPYGEGITYWPLRELLHGAFGDDVRREVATLLGEDPDAQGIADRLASAVGLGGGPFPAEETAWAARRTLEALARKTPVVVVVEDLHWAEATFLDLIERVASLATDAPILLLGLAKPELVEDRPGWGGGMPNASSILLEPLSEDQAGALVANLVEGPTRAPHIERIMAVAEGNPLFLEQMAATLDEAPRDGEVLVPPTIRALLAARLERLGPGERALLERAAVVGKEFYGGAVTELLPPEARSTVPRHLESLVRRRFVRPAPPSLVREATYQFRHVLIRDAAYQSLPKASRAELHERFADWLEGALGGVEAYEEILGYHLEQACLHRLGPAGAGESELATRASALLASAGRRALDRDDVQAARNLLFRAAELRPPDDRDSLSVRLSLAQALASTGELQQAEALLTEVADQARTVEAGDIEWRAEVHRAEVLDDTGQIEMGEFDRTIHRAIEAFTELGDDWGLAKSWSLLGFHHYNTGRAREAQEAYAKAAAHAARAGDLAQEKLNLVAIAACAEAGPTPVEEALVVCDETLDRVKGKPSMEARVHDIHAHLEAMRGNFEGARAELEHGRSVWRELGFVWMAAESTNYAAAIERLAGDIHAAERERRIGYEAWRAMGAKAYQPTWAAWLAWDLVELGRDDEALSLTKESEELADDSDITAQVPWRLARARVLARRGATEEAERLARDALAMTEDTDWIGFRGEALMCMAEVLRMSGRPDEAVRLARDAMEIFERKGNTVMASRARAFARKYFGHEGVS